MFALCSFVLHMNKSCTNKIYVIILGTVTIFKKLKTFFHQLISQNICLSLEIIS